MIYKKNPNFIPRKIADETILIPIQKQIDNIKSIYGMNAVASSFWDRLDGQNSVAEIKTGLAQEFDVDSAVLDQDINELISQLKEIDAIQPAS